MIELNTLKYLVRSKNINIKYGNSCVYFSGREEIQLKKNASCLSSIAGLAHEYGHHLSKINGNWSKRLRMAMNKNWSNTWTMTPTDRVLLFKEEIRAWQLGKKVLEDIGYVNWTYYYITAFYCLLTYLICFIEPLIFLFLSSIIFGLSYDILGIMKAQSLFNVGIIALISMYIFVCACAASAYFQDIENKKHIDE